MTGAQTTGERPDSHRGLVGGADGVSGGWVMAIVGTGPGSPIRDLLVWLSFADLWCYAQEIRLSAVTVDIPIGLSPRGDRPCDREARARLKGPPRRSPSVFPGPPLCTLGAGSWKEALEWARRETGKGISRQSYALLSKIAEVRDVLRPHDFSASASPRAAEVHPEVSFWATEGKPMRSHKSRHSGMVQRLKLLEQHFPNVMDAAVRTERPGPSHPGIDDLLDAVAAAWTARRLVSGEAEDLGRGEADPHGFPMSIRV